METDTSPQKRTAAFRLPIETLDRLDRLYHELHIEGFREATKEGIVAAALERFSDEDARLMYEYQEGELEG